MSVAVEVGRTFDALANATRRDIVASLAVSPVETPTLGQRFSISKQALNRHLVVLESAGLVTRTQHGRTQRIALAPEPLTQLSSWASEVHQIWESNLDRLASLIEDQPNSNKSRSKP